MGERVGIEADFTNIATLHKATPENFNDFRERIAEAPEYEELRNRLMRLGPVQQKLELQVLFAVGLAIEYFGSESVGYPDDKQACQQKMQRDKTYHDYAIDPLRYDSLRIKPLSEAGRSALCTEYAIFVKEALRRLGISLSYVAAEKQVWSDDSSFYHSFLVSADGKTIIDPLDTVQAYPTGLSHGVLTVSESFYSSKGPVTATESWSNAQRTYSLHHIEAPLSMTA